MALERQDVRFKLDADMKAALDAVVDVDNTEIGSLCEQIMVEYLRRRIHDATVLAARLERAGITGNSGESKGAR
jgi:hypothetical protein